MSFLRVVVPAILGSYLFALLVLGQPGNALAAYRRVHSAACHPLRTDADSVIYYGIFLANYGVDRNFYCSAPSDSVLSHSATTTLNVYGLVADANTNYSYACSHAYNSASTSCGTSKYWTAPYGGAYGVDTSAWTANPTSFPVVVSHLVPSSALYGFYMSN
jgi:hypothetical protein